VASEAMANPSAKAQTVEVLVEASKVATDWALQTVWGVMGGM